jgi:ABC-type molybdate transport system ATPase subunit
LNKSPEELSGGERQKVCLLQALLVCPKLLLLDESFSCLDSKTKTNLMKLLINYQAKYKTKIIYASHSKEELESFGAQTIFLENGKIRSIKK